MATQKKKCKTCKYRAGQQAHNGCDYYFITGELRGGTAVECKVYEKGKRIKTRKILTLG